MSQTHEEFRPHDAIDLTEQDSVFLVLEELGIAHMQHVWLKDHAPDHEDAQVVAEQAQEFFEDLCGIFAGRADASRVVPNGWAGAKLAHHLREAMPEALGRELTHLGGRPVEAVDDDTVIVMALRCYLASIEKLTQKDAEEKAAGRKLAPEIYIQVMAAWSGVFCGKDPALELPEAFRP